MKSITRQVKVKSVDRDERKRGAAGRMGTRAMGESVAMYDAHCKICRRFAEYVRVMM